MDKFYGHNHLALHLALDHWGNHRPFQRDNTYNQDKFEQLVQCNIHHHYKAHNRLFLHSLSPHIRILSIQYIYIYIYICLPD